MGGRGETRAYMAMIYMSSYLKIPLVLPLVIKGLLNVVIIYM